jgi:AAA domain, putative AbiEii toxin, Type IV TA system
VLESLRLQNFRCFYDHTVPLRGLSVVVGRNNAGKSTLVDALRLVSIVTSRYQALSFRPPPKWSSIPKREIGVSPSLEGMDFNVENLFHRYSAPPAIVTARFDNGASVKLYVGPDADLHAVISDRSNTIITSKARASELPLTVVAIMPQVAPLSAEERLLTPDYIHRNLFSSLAPLHFRNQLYQLKEYFPVFRTLAEDSWPGLQVRELSLRGPINQRTLSLLVRDESYVAEVATMGHGLQMWLQTMWFLARMPANATVILDEPDVYMHPDLQRRLIRHIRDRFKQTLVTTHSVEIVSEVAAEDILIVDRRRPESRFATSLPAVQRMIDHVGSVHNLQLARLWNAKRCVLVEGKDFRLLCDLFDVLFPDEPDGLATTPSMSIGGWGGWHYAVGSSMFLKNAGGENIHVYCILDRDYHTREQIQERLEQARECSVDLHVWSRKEIENFLLVAQIIQRVIASRTEKRVVLPNAQEVLAQLETTCSGLKDESFDAMATELLVQDRSLGQGGANKAARSLLDERWKTSEGRFSVVSGKAALARLSQWSQEQFGASLSASAIAKAFTPGEVPQELQVILRAIAGCQPLGRTPLRNGDDTTLGSSGKK